MNLSDKQLEATSRRSWPSQATSATNSASKSIGSSRNWSQSSHGTDHSRSRSSAGPARLKRGQATGPPRPTVDADVGVYFGVDDTSAFDIAGLQLLIKNLLATAYPQKSPDDFEDGARVFGIVFKGTGLEVDLVPIVSLDADANYGLQYSRGGTCVKTSVKVHIDHYRDHARDPFLASALGWRNVGGTGKNSTAFSPSTWNSCSAT